MQIGLVCGGCPVTLMAYGEIMLINPKGAMPGGRCHPGLQAQSGNYADRSRFRRIPSPSGIKVTNDTNRTESYIIVWCGNGYTLSGDCGKRQKPYLFLPSRTLIISPVLEYKTRGVVRYRFLTYFIRCLRRSPGSGLGAHRMFVPALVYIKSMPNSLIPIRLGGMPHIY